MLKACFVAVLFLSGCSEYGNELQYVEYGTVSVKLTDAPFPYSFVSEANVTITKVEARRKNISEPEDGENDNPFEVLFEGEVSANLLELTNGVTKSLGEAEVPVGTYDLVRVYVKDANVVLTDGTVYDMKVPSGAQTGIKVFIKPAITVVGELTTELLLDFDVSRSFVALGNTNSVSGIKGFNFKPVIKAANMTTSGTLAGTVTTLMDNIQTGLEGVQVGIIAADTLYTSTFTDAAGMYTIMGIEAGTYSVSAEFKDYVTQIVDEVSIIEGNKTVQDFELLPEE